MRRAPLLHRNLMAVYTSDIGYEQLDWSGEEDAVSECEVGGGEGAPVYNSVGVRCGEWSGWKRTKGGGKNGFDSASVRACPYIKIRTPILYSYN
ncbi:hypothetical protein BD410DRAFT_286376 [Rickenella mellea]|uniref:Uncharacterized protein n=1 Tax=Rickenella mellea TaxID=50990 RepID=A0A4Y7Q2I4_9AGAM|nr:hypothetical protein BD410DRAFT_286376 [Rickenella mellea]